MITDDEITKISYIIASRFEKVNIYYLTLLAEQVKEIGNLSPENMHTLEQVSKMGANIDSINSFLAVQTGLALSDIDKLYDTFFKNGQRKAINEEGEGGAAFGGGALGGGNLMAGSSDESGGVTYAFGGKNNVQRRPSYNSQRKKTGDVTKQDSNIDMSDAMDRTPGKIAMNRKK